jgi:hypothetical protein
MSTDWNGLDLQNNLADESWWNSTAEKARILRYINDGIQDICDRFDIISLRRTGKKVLTASTAEQELNLATPTAPTATLLTGGALTEGSVYTVLVTYYESASGRESIRGAASNSVTATSTQKAIGLSSIPVSSDPLVDKRKIYIKKDSGDYIFAGNIDDNTTTAASVSTEAIDYSGDGTGFTVTGTGADWSGASVQLEALSTPTDEMFYASFSSDIDADRSLGGSTGTSGSVTISGGKADLTGNVNTESITYTVATGDIMPQNTGTIEFRVTPDWTGNPTETQYFWEFARAAGGGPNNIELYYDTSGNWRFNVFNNGGFSILALTIADTGRFTSGTEVHVSINWDFDNGAHRLFVDGTQVGSTDTTTAIPAPRGTDAVDTLRIGNAIPPTGTTDPDFYIRDFQVFSEVQRTAAFTAPTIGYLYSTTASKIAYGTTLEALGLQSLTEVASTPTNTTVTYIITIDGTDYYISGGEWAVSDGTVSQSSSASAFSAALATFPAALDEQITQITAFLASSDGISTPTLTTFTVVYFAEGAIDENSSSTIEPPDYHAIEKIDGAIKETTSNRTLEHYSHKDLKAVSSSNSTGTPSAWGYLTESKLLLYPAPSSALTLEFFYFMRHPRVFANSDSILLPPQFKRVIESYVTMRVYQYKDWNGKRERELAYEEALRAAIRSYNNKPRRINKIRDVVGNGRGGWV